MATCFWAQVKPIGQGHMCIWGAAAVVVLNCSRIASTHIGSRYTLPDRVEHIYIYMYVYIYIWCPPHVPTFFCVLHFLYLFSGEIGGTLFGICCLPYVLLTCLTCAVGDGGALFGVDKRTCRYWIQYPRIGSNTGLDRRSKIEDAWESFWGIFNLPSPIQAGIGSNTRVLDPIPEYSTSIPVQVKN